MSEPTLAERFQELRHENKWTDLSNRFAFEMRTEITRAAIRDSMEPRTRFILGDKIRKALNVK